MVQKRLTSSIGRRDFLRYAGYTGMTVSMAGVLAACKDAETTSSGSARLRAGVDTADRGGAGRPAGLRLVRVRQRRLLPQGGEEVPLGPVREGDRRHARVRVVRERRLGLHEGGSGGSLRRGAPVRLPVQGLGRPRGAAAVGHLADPELLAAEPQAHDGRTVRRAAVLRAARLGVHRTAREPRPCRRRRRDVQRALRRAVQGQDRMGRHAQHDGGRRVCARHRGPLGHDRRGARRGARLPHLQEGARALLLEPVLRLLASRSRPKRCGRATRGPTRSATPTPRA